MTFDGVPVSLRLEGRYPQEDVSSDYMVSLSNEKQGVLRGDAEVNEVEVIVDEHTLPSQSWFARNCGLVHLVKLGALAALIITWWVSATAVRATG